MKVEELYEIWKAKASEDPALRDELLQIEGNADEINDRFYKELEFGTAGLRGVIGAGTNMMNVYTVGRATQGLSDYINSVTENGSAAIAYDSRIKSDLFAKKAAGVFAANGIKVYMYPELMPTPMLSFAVRRFKCDAGVVVTASHNPSKYNGYKAYGPDGCQLDVEASAKVLEFVNRVDYFTGIKTADFDESVKSGMIEFIGQDIIDEYLGRVQSLSLSPEECKNSGLSVVYTPLYGTGNKPVRAILDRIGIKNVTVVPSQEKPDGNFPEAPFPNPEIREAFKCALQLAEEVKPDLLLATDPDCDRVGIAVKDENGYTLMSGNEVGALMLNYLLERRTELNKMPQNPVAVETIVSTDLCKKIAAKYGVELIEVLTGFKYIGGQVKLLEEKGEEDRFIMGFEESYGYLSGSFVRDKDAVIGSMLICEMACYYKSKGLNLLEKYAELEKEFGVYLNVQKSFVFEGQQGMIHMSELMDKFRAEAPAEIDGAKVTNILDYEASENRDTASGETTEIKLPKSNVIAYKLDNGSGVIIRPSGTEPKIKLYISAVGKTRSEAQATADGICSRFSAEMV